MVVHVIPLPRRRKLLLNMQSAKVGLPYFNSCVPLKVVPPGVTLFNTATFYGLLNEEGFGANLRLLKTAIADIDRSKIQLMVKICMDTR
jgi:hypothetical protein